MKLTFKGIFALLVGVSLFYTACKKSSQSQPASQSQNDATVSGQIAMNLAQSLSGSFGGASIQDGVSPSTSVTSSTSKLNNVRSLVRSKTSACGFFTDNGIDYTSNIGDTIKSTTKGSINYFFNCKNGAATGYTVSDTLITTGTAPKYSFTYDISQDYDVTGLNTNNSQITLSGSLKSFVDFVYIKKYASNSTSVHNNYVLTDLVINQDDNYDITSGTATFVSTGTNSYGNWEFTGSIEFLGNHRAAITFIGKEYYVDLLTGVVTPK
jgi:hypothetical protein